MPIASGWQHQFHIEGLVPPHVATTSDSVSDLIAPPFFH